MNFKNKNVLITGGIGFIGSNLAIKLGVKVTVLDSMISEYGGDLRNYGQTKRYHYDYKGINSRLDELQAAILREKTPFLHEWNYKRARLASNYRNRLKNVSFLQENSYGKSSNHLFVVKAEDRDDLLKYLNDKDIASLIHYPIPIHKQKAFEYQKDEILPVVEKLTKQIVSLPIYPELTFDKQDYIIETINNYEG